MWDLSRRFPVACDGPPCCLRRVIASVCVTCALGLGRSLQQVSANGRPVRGLAGADTELLASRLVKIFNSMNKCIYILSLDIFKRLSQFDLNIYEVGHQKRLTVDENVRRLPLKR
jgi:hypothetical protein